MLVEQCELQPGQAVDMDKVEKFMLERSSATTTAPTTAPTTARSSTSGGLKPKLPPEQQRAIEEVMILGGRATSFSKQ